MKTKVLINTLALIVVFFFLSLSANAQHKFKIRHANPVSVSDNNQNTPTATNSLQRINDNTSVLTTACDTPNLSAYMTTWTIEDYYVGTHPKMDSGFVNGVNAYRDKAEAAYFANTNANTYVIGALIAFNKAYTTTPTKTLTISVYSVSGGNPGSLIGSAQTVKMSEVMYDVSNSYFLDVHFPSPVNVAGAAFFIVVNVTGLNWATSHDTLSMQSNLNGQTNPSAAWEYTSGSVWYQYSSTSSWQLKISLAVFPELTNVLAHASFTQSATTTCAGYPVSLDASASVESAVSWVLTGGTPSTSSSVTQTVTYATAGTYPITLYVEGGSCNNIDSMITSITINAAPVPNATATPTSICAGGSSTLNAANGISYQWDGYSLGTSAAQPVSPTSTTVYTVTVTGSNGCSASQSVTVTWHANPNPNASANPTLMCYGGVSLLSSTTGMSSYIWNPGGNTNASFVASPTTNTTYTVSVTDANGCTATGSATVNVNPQMTKSMTTTSAICGNSNGTATVTASGGTPGYTYLWSTSPAQTTACATGLAQGTYYVTVTDANACKITDTAVVHCVTGIISPVESNEGFSIIPNPSNGDFSLIINGYEGKDVTIDIFNAQGALVYSNKLNVTSNAYAKKLFLPNLKGIYSVRLLTKDAVVNHTIVIQ